MSTIPALSAQTVAISPPPSGDKTTRSLEDPEAILMSQLSQLVKWRQNSGEPTTVIRSSAEVDGKTYDVVVGSTGSRSDPVGLWVKDNASGADLGYVVGSGVYSTSALSPDEVSRIFMQAGLQIVQDQVVGGTTNPSGQPPTLQQPTVPIDTDGTPNPPSAGDSINVMPSYRNQIFER